MSNTKQSPLALQALSHVTPPRNPASLNNGSCSRERVLISKPSFEASIHEARPTKQRRHLLVSNPLMNRGTLKAVSNWNPVVRSIRLARLGTFSSEGVETVERNDRGEECRGWLLVLGVTQHGRKGVQLAKMAVADSLLYEGQ